MKRITIILTFLLFCSLTNAQRAASHHFFNQELRDYMLSFLSNPALQFFNPDSTYTDLSLNWKELNAGGLYIVEGGNKLENMSFNVHSFKRKDRSVLYGGTSYESQRNYNVHWSNVADYQLVSPYIIADTVGGTSKQEVYSFLGGFAYRWNNKLFGISAKYRAGKSYRTIDPRPKSTTSDFSINAGFAFESASYYLGISLMYEGYKQEHGVAIYRPGDGGNSIYYMKGLGIRGKRFSTVISKGSGVSCNYDLDSYKFSLQWFPKDVGYFSAIYYKRGKLDLNDSNSYNAYIKNKLNINNYYAEFGRQFLRFRLKAYAGFQQKKGLEYDYEQGQSLVYLNLAPRYTQKEFSGGLVFFATAEDMFSDWSCFIKAGLGYYKYKEEYQHPSPEPRSSQEFEFLSPELMLGASKQYAKSSITLKMAMRYDHCLSKELNEPSEAIPEAVAVQSLVLPDFEYLSAKKVYLSPQLRYDIDLKNNYGIYLMLQQFSELYIDARPKTGLLVAFGLTL